MHILQKDHLYLQVQRVKVDYHLRSSMRLHLDLACVKLTNTEVKLNKTAAKLNYTEVKLNETSAKLNDARFKLNETQVKLNATEEKLEATRKVVEKLETRIFLWKINNFSVIVGEAKIKRKTSIDSVPFYTDRTESYGYKLKLRIYPDGDFIFRDNLLVAIVVMKDEYDAILPWPFKKKVIVTLINQKEDPVKRKNVTHLPLDPENSPKAFARPVKEENEEYRCFCISHVSLHSKRYVVNDTVYSG